MITLSEGRTDVVIDPAHGGEIASLEVDGVDILGRVPWPRRRVDAAADVEESDWTLGFQGGWQLLFPNAGEACHVGTSYHGFHGAASRDGWQVLRTAAAEATMAWSGHGLAVERTVVSHDRGVVVEVTIRALHGTVPCVVVEHVTLNADLLTPTAALDLPVEAGRRWVPLADLDRSHFSTVDEVPESHVVLSCPERQVGVRLSWSGTVLRNLWLWHEDSGLQEAPWSGRTRILGLEPASTRTHGGLQHAIEEGSALMVDPHAPVSYRVSLSIEGIAASPGSPLRSQT